jgi:hypothetical protein
MMEARQAWSTSEIELAENRCHVITHDAKSKIKVTEYKILQTLTENTTHYQFPWKRQHQNLRSIQKTPSPYPA